MLFANRKRRIERLLLVEDEPLIAFDTEHFLTDAGFEVVATVDRVTDACAHLDAGTPLDLVLVDLNLADGSGLDVARTARARDVAVLFVAGDCPAEADALGFGWLAKPYSQRHLLSAIKAIDQALSGKAPKRLPAGFTLFERRSGEIAG